jgi:hypothetical protein
MMFEFAPGLFLRILEGSTDLDHDSTGVFKRRNQPIHPRQNQIVHLTIERICALAEPAPILQAVHAANYGVIYLARLVRLPGKLVGNIRQLVIVCPYAWRWHRGTCFLT